ncbi:MAG: EAL domain-containing protein [Pseudoxanthomonas sp.]|nr:EAL domain-containing protein [Pseudoxanthomonas sp.]
MATAPVRICFVDDLLENAERLVSVLRNAGLAVRPNHVADIEDFAELIGKEAPDLVLVSVPGPINPADLTDQIGRAGKDVAVIVLVEQMDGEVRIKGFDDGAVAVELRQPALVVAVVKRQFEQLRTRREVRKLETALRESERRCDALLDSSRDPVAYVHEGMHIRANRAYLEMFGFDDFEDIESMPLLDLVASADAEGFKAVLKRMAKGEPPPDSLELHLRNQGGESFPGRMEFSSANYAGEPCVQLIIRKPAEDPALAAELVRLKERDLVTDLYNRTYFTSLLEKAADEAAGGKRNHALLLLEPDDFANLQTQVGVGQGDLLLADLAKATAAVLGPDDVAARFSDHQFAVLTTSAHLDAARELADRIRQRMSDHIFEIGQRSISLTMSVGGALICEKLNRVPALLTQATATCRAAIAEGGNRVILHDPYAEERAESSRNAHWQRLVKEALGHDDGFVLFYQPVVCLQGGDGDYHEVLLRMNSPRGEILPSYFLPAAQQSGLMPQIDRWVVSHALRKLASYGKKPPTFFVSLSAETLEDETFAGWLAEQVRQHRVSGERLVLQLSESEAATSVKQLKTLLGHLSQLHIAFAIKDFGAGLASYQLLKHVPAQYLKVDKNYLSDFAGNTEFQKKVTEICEKAHASGMMVIAPHVADMASVSVLYQCGVNFVQGNFLHEPARTMAAGAAAAG